MPSHILYKEDVARDIVGFWNSNDPAEIKVIAENLSIRKFKKNEIIYHERQKPTRMLYLVSGKVKIVKEGGVGRTPIVNAIKEKHFFGFRAFLQMTAMLLRQWLLKTAPWHLFLLKKPHY